MFVQNVIKDSLRLGPEKLKYCGCRILSYAEEKNTTKLY